jgi:hypothetical protein
LLSLSTCVGYFLFHVSIRKSARRPDRTARDPAVDPRVTALAAVSVAAMAAQRADTLDYCREPAQDLAHVIRDQRIEVGAVGRETERLPDRPRIGL